MKKLLSIVLLLGIIMCPVITVHAAKIKPGTEVERELQLKRRLSRLIVLTDRYLDRSIFLENDDEVNVELNKINKSWEISQILKKLSNTGEYTSEVLDNLEREIYALYESK